MATNRSAEAELRNILMAALKRPRRRTVADVLANMPDVGEDADFDVRNNGLTVVTRNVDDFSTTGVNLQNPFD